MWGSTVNGQPRVKHSPSLGSTPNEAERFNNRTTGPSALPPAVRHAMSAQIISHRSNRFADCLSRVVNRLQPLFGTAELVMPFTCSGTGGMEAAIVNTLVPGQRVLAIRVGVFGDRFAEIAAAFGAEVVDWCIPWGHAADPEELRGKLHRSGTVAAVLVTHSESSTGVINPLEEIARVIHKESDALVVVDAIGSIGAAPMHMDEWGLDVVVTASQKALMSPPGLAIVAASQRVMTICGRKGTNRFYFDFSRMSAAVSDGTTTYTPGMSVIFALDEALGLIEAEGLESVYSRHQRLRDLCRRGVAEAGLQCLATPDVSSPTVTAAILPSGHSAQDVRRRLEVDYGILVSQGRAHLKEQMLRIGHMGWVTEAEVTEVVEAIAMVLSA